MVLTAVLAIGSHVRAVPLLGSARDAGTLRVYLDSERPTTFYYAPGKLSVALGESDVPRISFLQMRYMGAGVTGDKGEFRTLSVLSFGVKMASIKNTDLSAARTALRKQGLKVYSLRPLPIRKVEATLNYVPLREAAESPEASVPQAAGSGDIRDVEGAKPTGGYWSERVFTITPDDSTSQALWDAFQTGRVMLSLSYSFHSEGIAPAEEKPRVEGNVEISVDSEAQPGEDEDRDVHIVLADTVAVTVDASEYPDRFKKIDINEDVPANYAALSIYCYDFNNSIRPDLYEKAIEIEATSVTGKPITREVSFSKSSPEIYSATVRFPFAVSLKHPYRYRVREITNDGRDTTKPWRDGKEWSQILDVTTPPEEQPVVEDDTDS